MEKEKLWTKEFLIIAFMNFLTTIVYFILMVTMSSYAKDTYGASVSMAGLVASIFVIGSLAGRLTAGRIMTSYGAVKVLFISLVLFTVASSGYYLANVIPTLLVIRIIQGFTVGMIGTATGTIIAQIIPIPRRGEGIGYFSLSNVLASAIGPFIGIIFLKLEDGYQWLFFMNVLVGIISLIILKLANITIANVHHESHNTKTVSFFAKFIDPKAVPISFLALVFGFSYSGVMSYLSLYSKEINLVNAASYFFLVHAIVVTCSRPITGRLIDSKGANVIVYPCIIIFVAGMLLYSQATAPWMILVAAALFGLGWGNFNSTAQTLAIKFTVPNRIGLATATYFIFIDLGMGLGPFILGYLIPNVGFRMLYVVSAVIALLCIPLYHVLYGHKDKMVFQEKEAVCKLPLEGEQLSR